MNNATLTQCFIISIYCRGGWLVKYFRFVLGGLLPSYGSSANFLAMAFPVGL